MKKIIIIFLLYFSLPPIGGECWGSVAAKLTQNTYVDSAIFYFQKCNAKNKIDSVLFLKGIKMIDSIPCKDEHIKRIESIAENFKKLENPDYYCSVKYALFMRFYYAKEYFNAFDYAENIILKTALSTDILSVKLRQLMQFEIRRVVYSKKNKKEDIGFDYYSEKLKYYLQKNDSHEIFICYFILSGYYGGKALQDLAVYLLKKSGEYVKDKSVAISNKINNWPLFGRDAWINVNACIEQTLVEAKHFRESLIYSRFTLKQCLNNTPTFWDSSNIAYTYHNLAYAKLKLGETDSVKDFLNIAINVSKLTKEYHTQAFAYQILGMYYFQIKKYDSAETVLNHCKELMKKYKININSPSGILVPEYYIAIILKEKKYYKEAAKLLTKQIPKLQDLREYSSMEYKLLAEVYICLNDYKNATDNFQNYIAQQDLIKKEELENRTESFEMEKKMNDAENTISNLQTQKEVATVSRNYLIGIAILLFVIAGIIYNRYRLKHRTNAELAKTLQELKDTQEQLLKSEKLAAFGSVATRVAHEILNPINFVNNFSNISSELIDEIKSAKTEEEKNEIMNDIKNNLEKINHHGKRADDIVKELFKHTREGTAHEYFD